MTESGLGYRKHGRGPLAVAKIHQPTQAENRTQKTDHAVDGVAHALAVVAFGDDAQNHGR